MKKKGFTLIELLAVIVILAIIALIATPIVMNLINKARKGTVEATTHSYVSAVKNAIVNDLTEDEPKNFKNTTCSLTINNKMNCDNNEELVLDIKGDRLDDLEVYINDSNIIEYGTFKKGEYCGTYYNNKKIEFSTCDELSIIAASN